jgi:hypothetical protein
VCTESLDPYALAGLGAGGGFLVMALRHHVRIHVVHHFCAIALARPSALLVVLLFFISEVHARANPLRRSGGACRAHPDRAARRFGPYAVDPYFPCADCMLITYTLGQAE